MYELLKPINRVSLFFLSLIRFPVLVISQVEHQIAQPLLEFRVVGISSVVSYNLGRSDKGRLSRLFRISVWIVLVASAAVTVISYLLSGTVVNFFAKGNEHVATISLHGFRIVATSFIMMAVNVFASGWFTALNDGKTSAILSFCRTIIFMVIPVLVLPQIFEMDGLWLSISAGEMLSLAMSIYFFIRFRDVWLVSKPSVDSAGDTE